MTNLAGLLKQADDLACGWVKSTAQISIKSDAFPGDSVGPRILLDHGRFVSSVLQEWGADVELQAVGLLHSLSWNSVIPLGQIEKYCEGRVAYLCQEYQRILEKRPEARWRGKPHVLEQIKHFSLAYADHDLALLAAADLWHHYQLSKDGNSAHQKSYRDIAIQVIRPYLHFLGMTEMEQALLNDMKEVDGSEHSPEKSSSQIQARLGQDGSKEDGAEEDSQGRDASYEIKQRIKSRLPNAAINWRSSNAFLDADGASSSLASSSLLGDSGTSVGSASTEFAAESVHTIGLLVDNEEHCYRALYHLHQLFRPIEGSVRDYVANCKFNGYRSLQTTVANEESYIQFEISTRDMEEGNLWGLVASHLKQQNQTGLANAWWNADKDTFSLIESAAIGTLDETFYVFSPQGELFGFHRGCTAIDYAYAVYGEAAAQSRRFLINSEVVEPVTALHHLDMVEVELDASAPGPTRVWLSAARTPRARNYIAQHLKRYGEGVSHAQKMLDKRLKALEEYYGFNMPEHRIKQALSREMKRRHITSQETLMSEISSGRLNTDQILQPLFADEIIRQVQLPADVRLRPHQLILAQCCRPKPGDDIIGKPYHRNKVTTKLRIHRLACKKLGQQTDGYIELKWRLHSNLHAVAQIEMRALDESGLLGDAINQIYAAVPQVTLHRSETSTRNGVATARFVIEAPSEEVIDEIADGLRHLPNRTVDEVHQINLPHSEREELVRPVSTSEANPYSRMPVYEEGMFFGRSRELSEIRDWLRTRVGIIWLVGQKRVGKTSLLLHLKNHFLDSSEFTPIYLDFQMLSTLQPADIFFEIANSVYSELQSEGRGAELGPPLQAMFEHDPMGHLVNYLRSAQSHRGVGKLVLMLDEFSRTTDAHQHGKLNEHFFIQWRGLVQMTQPYVKYVVVVQQQAFDGMNKRVQGGTEDPSWRLIELGEKRILRPLTDKDARNLIEWPIRNYIDSTPDLLERIHALTGSSPFLIQSFCFKLVSHMVQLDKRQLEWADLDAVRMEFLSPNESVFAHLLDLIQGVASSLSLLIAQIADEEMQRNSKATPLVSWEQIAAAHPVFLSERLRATLSELCESHILISTNHRGTESWRFSSLLFQEWLALNSVKA